MATLDSIDGLISSAMSNNTRPVLFQGFTTANSTAANITSGSVTIQRCPASYTTSNYGGGVTSAYPFVQLFSENQATMLAALEISMGTLTINGNSFADGSTMGTKSLRVGGASYTETLASIFPVVFVSATATSTTPVLTITYVNQAGTGGRTCTMTLPSNVAINSCFAMAPHLQSGDTGVRDISNMSISTGTAGTLKVLGLLPIYVSAQNGAGSSYPMTEQLGLNCPFPIYPMASGDIIGFYLLGTFGTTEYTAVINLIADVT